MRSTQLGPDSGSTGGGEERAEKSAAAPTAGEAAPAAPAAPVAPAAPAAGGLPAERAAGLPDGAAEWRAGGLRRNFEHIQSTYYWVGAACLSVKKTKRERRLCRWMIIVS